MTRGEMIVARPRGMSDVRLHRHAKPVGMWPPTTGPDSLGAPPVISPVGIPGSDCRLNGPIAASIARLGPR